MTSTAPTSTWTPPPGRHAASLGNSLTRALKARQNNGDAQPIRSLHEKDFYSFRYNFKPGQVDSAGRGKIALKRPKESSNVPVSVEHPSTRPGEMHSFTGEQMPTKEFDCVLIFDETSGTFTLEKLDSIVKLNYSKKYSVGGKTITPPPPPPPAAADPDAMNVDLANELEQELLSTAEASDGEIDQELFEEMMIPSSISRKHEQKPPSRAIAMEEEEEEEDIPMATTAHVTKPPPPPPVAAKPVKPGPKPKAAKPAKSTPKAVATPAQPSPRPTATTTKVKPTPPKPAPPKPAPPVAAAPAPAPAPTAAPTKARPPPVPRPTKKKREPEAVPTPPVSAANMGGDVEILSFGKPSKRPRVSPPPQPVSEGLALPGSTTAVNRPPPVMPPVAAAAPPPPPISAPAEMSESEEEDWDEVAAVVPVPPTTASADASVIDEFDIFGEAMDEDEDKDGEGEDQDLFANELDKELGLHMEEDSDEDFLQGMVEEAPPSAVIPPREGLGGGPISLKAYAGDGDDSVSEDDYSSDESDD